MEAGVCACGCGGRTKRVERNSHGYRKGEHRRYIHGHHAHKDGPEYLVDEQTGCWNWVKTIDGKGYGVIKINQEQLMAHRVVYERHKGAIPEGLVIDHVKCSNPRCVNPEHLEPVTLGENTRRAAEIRFAWMRAAIRDIPHAETNASAARRLGVCLNTIRKYRVTGRYTDLSVSTGGLEI